MASLLIERLQFVAGIAPIADAHAGGVVSDVYDMRAFERLVFVVYRGVATGGTAAPTYTALACDDVTPTNTTAVPFRYRKSLGAVATATATGFQATAGSAAIDLIEVDARDLASTGYGYIQLNIAETVNDPVVAAVLAIGEAKIARNTYPTVTD
jgi:hypothetical protein